MEFKKKWKIDGNVLRARYRHSGEVRRFSWLGYEERMPAGKLPQKLIWGNPEGAKILRKEVKAGS